MKRYIIFLVEACFFLPLIAQQSAYFYHYGDKVIQLPVDSTRLVVISNGELSQPMGTYGSETTCYNIVSSSKSNMYNNVVPFNKKRSCVPDIYFSTIDIPANKTQQSYDGIKAQLMHSGNVCQILPSFTVNGKRVDPTDNFYVQLKSADDISLLQTMASQYNIFIVGNNEFMPLWYTLSCMNTSGMTAIEAANLFHTSGKFVCSEPEFLLYDIWHSDDPYYSSQWNLKNTGQYGQSGLDINVEDAWEITKGDGVIVAVLDQGIDLDHPDLEENIYPQSYNITTGTSPSRVNGKHGTACAGIIGAVQDNGIGISGVAPEVQLMSISDSARVSVRQLADGLNWAWMNGAHVISNSWGYGQPSSLIDAAIYSALTNGRGGCGTVVVFSSGNSGDAVSYPANSDPRILAVGGINYAGRRMGTDSIGSDYYFNSISCYGEELDVVAPTLNIYTTDVVGSEGYSPSSYYSGFGGTSAACPQVAGVAALMLSVNPYLKVERVAEIIESTARKVSADWYTYTNDSIHKSGTWNEELGYGLIDAGAAVALAAKDLETTYVRDVVIDYPENYNNTYVEVENVTIQSNGYVESEFVKSAILRSSVVVEEGGYLYVYPW